jgi:hypothetical protein
MEELPFYNEGLPFPDEIPFPNPPYCHHCWIPIKYPYDLVKCHNGKMVGEVSYCDITYHRHCAMEFAGAICPSCCQLFVLSADEIEQRKKLADEQNDRDHLFSQAWMTHQLLDFGPPPNFLPLYCFDPEVRFLSLAYSLSEFRK